MRAGVILGVVIALGAASAHAGGDFSEAVDALCQKQRICMQEQLGGQEIPPQMRQMMEQMLDGMCVSIQQSYQSAGVQGHPLHDSAVACMNSLAVLSCGQLQDGYAETAACQAYEQQAQKYTD